MHSEDLCEELCFLNKHGLPRPTPLEPRLGSEFALLAVDIWFTSLSARLHSGLPLLQRMRAFCRFRAPVSFKEPTGVSTAC